MFCLGATSSGQKNSAVLHWLQVSAVYFTTVNHADKQNYVSY